MKKYQSIIYMIIIAIITFCILAINLFLYFKNVNKLYEDKTRRVDNTYFSYPYFESDKDIFIEEYLNTIDTFEVDSVKYIVNYLGDYVNIIFKNYKNNLIVDYHSIIFDEENNVTEIGSLITDENILNEKLLLLIKLNNKKITEDELKIAKKSYLFKDRELEIYLTDYNEIKSITTIILNYWEIKDYLKIPYDLDNKYELIKDIPLNKENPIIPPMEISPQKKLVAFTFDDGPSSYTLELMDILEEYNANATFFLVGYNIKVRNTVVLDMYSRGFEIGNHTTDHSKLTKFDCSKAQTKINGNDELFHNITNDNMKMLRPPYGAYNDAIKSCAGVPIIMWSVDSRDWESRNTEKIVDVVLSSIKEGDIVLFHDLYATTIEAVKILLPVLYADGYQVVNVSQLYASKNIILENGSVYKKLVLE